MIMELLRKYAPPVGPVLSLALIGLLLLSALLYYRAVRIQRFLEPALAFSHPRNNFTKNLKEEFQKQFGAKPVKGIAITMTSIQIDKSQLFSQAGEFKRSSPVIKKLGRFLLALLRDKHSRSDMSLILILGRFPTAPGNAADGEMDRAQHLVGVIQDSLLNAVPELAAKYSHFCAAAVLPTVVNDPNNELIEVRIIPSEVLHIEMLQKLVKYAQ